MSLKFFYEFYKETTHFEMTIFGVINPSRDNGNRNWTFIVHLVDLDIISSCCARHDAVWY